MSLTALPAYETAWQTDEVRYYQVRNDQGTYKVYIPGETTSYKTISNIDAFIAAFADVTLEAYYYGFTMQEDGEVLADLTKKYAQAVALEEV